MASLCKNTDSEHLGLRPRCPEPPSSKLTNRPFQNPIYLESLYNIYPQKPLKLSLQQRGKDRLPTIHFQFCHMLVSLRPNQSWPFVSVHRSTSWCSETRRNCESLHFPCSMDEWMILGNLYLHIQAWQMRKIRITWRQHRWQPTKSKSCEKKTLGTQAVLNKLKLT